MNNKLTSVHPNGKPVLNDTTKYSLTDSELLEANAIKSLDNGEEEDFSEECIVEHDDGTREVYVARFKPHGSWGLKGQIEHPKDGKFALWLEFARDADE